MVPLSLEVFLGTLEDFNRMIRPMQALAVMFGLMAVWVVLKPQQMSGRLLGLVLASSWASTGLFYHLGVFAELNFWDYPVGVMFLVQAAGLFFIGAVMNWITAAPTEGTSYRIGLALGFYALAGAPLIGLAAGRGWAEVGYFASSPGPTILFTAAVLLMVSGRWLAVLWPVPVIAALLVTIFGVSLGIYEDAAVFPLVAAALMIKLRSRSRQNGN
ncbi:MAG: DUF6064 family protein [Pseudomonadota bacterium]